MSSINRVGRGLYGAPPAGSTPSRGTAGGVGFRVAQPPAEASHGTAGEAGAAEGRAEAAATSPVALGCMLSLQLQRGPTVQDQQARRRGQDLLKALAELQQALLSGAGEGGDILARLGALSSEVPAATDPALRGLVSAVAARAWVELARHGR